MTWPAPPGPVCARSPDRTRSRSRWRKAWGAGSAPAATAIVVGALTAVVIARDPFQHHLTPTCPFHALTGLWCPFCGGTRAVWAVAHGDFRLMLHANALLPALVVGAAWAWLAWAGRTTGWWRLAVPRGRGFNVALVVVLVAFTVVRNLPGLGALAPPGVT